MVKKKMRAAVFEGNGVLNIKEVDTPQIRKPDDLIVEVEMCSICGTDVHIMSVPPGYIAIARDNPRPRARRKGRRDG